MQYQYLIGQRVKGFANSVVVAASAGILTIECEINGLKTIVIRDLSEVEILT